MNFRLFTASSVVALAFTATPAFAQDEPVDDTSIMGDAIVVTARRVEEQLQDVPVAVTAIQGEALEQLGIESAVDLRTAVAGLAVTNAAGRTYTPIYAIRGQRSGDQVFTQDPPVAVYLDEVLISPIAGSNTGLFDLENVQVLKGPQGTLFGRNTTGGAVLYTSARPTDQFEGKLTVGYGNYDFLQAGGYINIPAGDGIRVRLAADYKNHGGYGKLVAGPETGANAMGFESYAGRLSVELEPSDSFEVLTILSYSHYVDEGGPAFNIIDTPRPTGFANLIFNTDFVVPGNAGLLDNIIADQRSRSVYDYASGELNGAESDIFTLTNHITVELSDTLTLKNIFGYRNLDTWDAADYDGTILPILAASNAARANNFSNELQLQGTGFDDKLDFIFGLYYFDEQGEEGTGLPYMDSRNQLVGTVAFGGAPRLQFARIKNQSFSGFGQLSYHLNEQLTLNAGIRYSVDERTAISTVGTAKVDPNTGLATPATCEYLDANGDRLPATYDDCQAGGSVSFAQPSWLIGLDFQPDPDTLLYIAHRHSYRSGGFQSRPFSNGTANLPFKPEIVDDLEIGFKRDWRLGADLGLRTNVAGYYQWYSDIQRNSSTLTPVGIGNVTRNAASANIYGLEAETELRIGRIARLAVNYAFTKPSYNSFPTQIFDPSINDFRPQDRSDYRFTYIPRHQINGSLSITPDVGDIGDLTLTANGYYQSRTYFGDDYSRRSDLLFITNDAPLPPDDQIFYGPKGYAVFNARAELADIAGSGFSVAVWGKNILDKTYVDSGVLFQDSIGFGTGIYGPPATYGVDVSIKF